MSKYDCTSKINELAEQLAINLRSDQAEIFNGTNSFRGAIALMNRSLGKKYNPSQEYKSGDMVSKDGDVFIATAASTGIDPTISANRPYWSYFINPYTSNKSKIKAFCVHQGGTILKSYNIASLSAVTYTDTNEGNLKVFEFTFIEEMGQIPVLMTSLGEGMGSAISKDEVGLNAMGLINQTTGSTITYPIGAEVYGRLDSGNYYCFDDASALISTVIWLDNSDSIPTA